MEPTFELQLAAMSALRASPQLTAIVGSKIYDRVPEKQVNGQAVPDVTSPYISFGPQTAISDDADCIDGLEVTFQVDAWSWGSGEAFGSAQVKKISGLVRAILHNAELSLSDNALVTLSHQMTRILRDPGGTVNHAAIQFSAIIETP